MPTSAGKAKKENLVASCVAGFVVLFECKNKVGLDRTDLVAMNEYALLMFSLNP